MAHQPKTFIYIEFKSKNEAAPLSSAFECVRSDVAGWLHGEMLLHHTPQLQKS